MHMCTYLHVHAYMYARSGQLTYKKAIITMLTDLSFDKKM